MFSSITGRLAQAGLCSVVLRDGWPRYGSFNGRVSYTGLCSAVLY